MVTGGFNGRSLTSVELLLLNGTRLCALPDLPGARHHHSQSGLLACGGGHSRESEQNSCVKFSGGTWEQTHTLGQGRYAHTALWANHLKGWWFFWNWPLSGLQGVEVCAGLLQSVPRGAAECVQGYRVCAGCSFNILPCSSRLNQKIFY